MILIIDLTSNTLHKKEFISPISNIVKENYEIINYKDLKDASKYSKIIISGTALKDFEYAGRTYFPCILELEKLVT